MGTVHDEMIPQRGFLPVNARMSDNILIVYDSAQAQFLNNRVFLQRVADRYPGASFISRFADLVVRRSWRIVTGDVYLAQPEHTGTTLCISEMLTPYTQRILARGAVPAVLWSGESPNVAWRFYRNLGNISSSYAHALLFEGVRSRSRAASFHPLRWPNSEQASRHGLPWRDRELLVMVASNKRRYIVSSEHRYPAARVLLKWTAWQYLRATDSMFALRDLYGERLAAIRYFGGRSGFRLYGMGWDRPNGLAAPFWSAAKRSGAVPVEDKTGVLGRFRFCLCFENCIFPGYITEKIFDCFFGDCIPIYLGAPDITSFIPAEAFIDYRRFGHMTDLEEYLRSMTENEAKRFRDAACAFLNSSSFRAFRDDTVAHQLVEMCESALAAAS